MGRRRVVRNDEAGQGLRGEGGGAGGGKLAHMRQKETKHKQQGFQGKGKEGVLWRTASVLCPREPGRQGRRRVGRVWAGQGQEEAL